MTYNNGYGQNGNNLAHIVVNGSNLGGQPFHIIKGATGARGKTGATGATGSVVQVFVDSTTTGLPNTPAKVELRQTGERAYFNFVIPKGEKGEKGEVGQKGEKGDVGQKGEKGDKGEVGKTTSVSVGTTTTLEPGEKAVVANSGDAEKLVLDFSIPRGATGQNGASATIMVGDVSVVEPEEEASVTNVGSEQNAIFNFYIPRGATGAKGVEQNINATILNMAGQDISTGVPISLFRTLTNNRMIITENSITVPDAGTYFVAYYVNRASGAAGTDGIALAINGVRDNNTARPLSESSTSSGQFVLNLQAGSSLTLVPVVINAKRIDANGGPGATLTVMKIS